MRDIYSLITQAAASNKSALFRRISHLSATTILITVPMRLNLSEGKDLNDTTCSCKKPI